MPRTGHQLPPAPAASSPAARSVMRANRSFDTEPEARLRSALHRAGLRFRKHAQPVANLRCRPDVVFSSGRVAVFVDGCYWHGCPTHWRPPRSNRAYWVAKIERNRARDRRNDQALSEAGWLVLRVWEHEEPDAAAHRIGEVVRRRRQDAAGASAA